MDGIGILLAVVLSWGCGANDREATMTTMTATFGSGCFWCTEAVFERLAGVERVVSGYSGGHVDNPTYEQVCSGTTGHAESVQVTYNPAELSYAQFLKVFWKTHDPTTRNRQGNDIGPQYRSVIFYHDEEQRKLAQSYKDKHEAEGIWNRPIVTEIVPFTRFWPAKTTTRILRQYPTKPTDRGHHAEDEKFESISKDRLKPR